MSKIYELLPDIFGEHTASLAGKLDENVSFRRGSIIGEALPTPLRFFTGHSVSAPPRSLLGTVIPVMSNELVDALTSAGVSNLQCFPAVLESSADGTEWTDYSAINIVGLIACADLDNSEFDKLLDRPGKDAVPLLAFSDLKVDITRSGNADLFRLAESPGVILMSEALVKSLLARHDDDEWGITLLER